MRKVILLFVIFSTLLLCSCKEEKRPLPPTPYDLDEVKQLVTALEKPVCEILQKDSVTKEEYNSFLQYYKELCGTEKVVNKFRDICFSIEETNNESDAILINKDAVFESMLLDENVEIMEAYTMSFYKKSLYEENYQWYSDEDIMLKVDIIKGANPIYEWVTENDIELEPDIQEKLIDTKEGVREYEFARKDGKWILLSMGELTINDKSITVTD